MDDSIDGEVDFYHNAVKVLEDFSDSDDDEPTPTPVKEEKTLQNPIEVILPQKRKTRTKQGIEDDVSPPPKTRTRAKRQARYQYNCEKAVSASPVNGIRMLDIIEINDSPTRPIPNNIEQYSINSVPHFQKNSNSQVELARQLNDSSDTVALDDSFSCVDLVDLDDVAVHVKWRGKAIQTFHLKKRDKFLSVFQHFAKLESVSQHQVLLTHSGESVSMQDSPEKYESGVIILDGSLKKLQVQPELPDPDQIELKVLRKDTKGKLSIFISRTDTVSVFMNKTANALSLPRERLQFMFDGETLSPDDTPDSLDLEGGECIEVTVRP